MLLKNFIEKFRWFNSNAEVYINGVPLEDNFEIAYGTNEGVEPYNCELIDIVPKRNKESGQLVDLGNGLSATVIQERHYDMSDTDLPSFLNGNRDSNHD